MDQLDSSSNVASRAINSITEFCQSVSKTSGRNRDQRSLRFESLEDRCVLSADGLDLQPDAPLPSETQLVAPESPLTDNSSEGPQQPHDQTTITSVTVRVNNEVVVINPVGDALEMNPGDEFEVLGVEFDSGATHGVFAAEGYVNKINSESSASLIDYNDGRFSLIEDNFSADGTGGMVDGLSGKWVAETGWDRLTISLLHYMENETVVASRSLIQLEVGQADFAFDETSLRNLQNADVRVGEAFEIYGAWFNNGTGEFHNYAEVDIYHTSNKNEIVWAGALVGNTSAENRVEGFFVNTRADDGFSEVFTPAREGHYMLRFYLDPEHVVQESDEANNNFDVWLEVKPANRAPVAVDDGIEGRVNESLDSIDVLANDLDTDGDQLQVENLTQPEHGQVELNEDGTVSYTPDDGFVGTDEFQYSVTDGEFVSESAAVSVQVAPDGFSVEPEASGDEDKNIKLKIEADKNQFTHVRVSNLPTGAELNRGDARADGSYDVDVKDLKKLKLTPPLNFDGNFTLSVTPFNGQTAWIQLSETIDVSVNAVVDGGFFDVANFAIVTGSNGALPYDFGFEDVDGSERHTVTFDGLPDFVSLSAGERVGDSWLLDFEDMAELQIRADKVSDLADFESNRLGYYRRFDVQVTVRSVEADNGDLFEQVENFTFLALQRT